MIIFENFEYIGKGAFGEVNRVYAKNLRKIVALKCLHDSNSNDEFYEFYKKFMNEVNDLCF